MASHNTVATLDGLYKKIYGDKGPIDLIPDNSILQDLIPFAKAERTGHSFNTPVVLSTEHGFAYGLADETITLNDSVAATLKEVSVKGTQLIGQASLNYDAASRSASSPAAFMNGAHLVVKNLYQGASKRLEASLLYGTKGIGTVDSLSSQDIVLKAASFADGLWMGMENAVIDVYQANGTVRQAGLVVSAVNPDTYTITVVGTTTGIADTDVIFMKGSYGKECYGIDAIATNTGSMFGVDASAYSLWKGSSYAAGGAALTMAKVLNAVSKAVSKGGLNDECVVLVHPSSWNNLNADQAALRQYVSDEKEAKNGFGAITYRGANGLIKVMSHPMVKRGEAFVLPVKEMKRIGSQDISSATPGRSDEIFLHSSTLSAYVLRVYSNQAIVCMKPAQMVKITGIVPA
ncbi:hypothetical protein ACES2J_08330 [Bdellovibrio bacteriovorus]|uniref:hypothetical protein n=1 Tax=Bdellovibrio bacteriovorus TaxID=959 RepID=UPI0035A5AEA2